MLIYGVRESRTLEEVVSNVLALHRMASGNAEEKKFHQARVKNATHQVALRAADGWIFAPVKWSGARHNTISRYPANQRPVTDQFKPVVIALGFLPISSDDSGHDELYEEYVSYCARYGFVHSDTLQDRTFYVQDDDFVLAEQLPSYTTYHEGSSKTINVNAYERNPEARRKCIALHGCKCVVCDFDFAERYGELGRGYIHVHHLVPISSIGKNYQIVPEKDLVPVCPNCHAMLHRKGLKSVEELKTCLQ